MRIHVTANHQYLDEIQTIAQVFFPHARFGAKVRNQKSEVRKGIEINNDNVLTAEHGWSIASFIEDGKAHAEVYFQGNLAERYCLLLANQPEYLTEKRLAMLVLYHALQNAIGANTPWGALTGVRPTKMVREWMAEGLTDNQVIQALQGIFCVQEDRAKLAVDVAHGENRLANRIWAGYPTRGNPSSILHKPVGIYISIPFCPSRCVYCSFNTAHKPWSIDMQTRYVQALASEIQELPQKLSEIGGRVSSIYIGGGTPTALADNLLELLLYTLTNVLAVTDCKSNHGADFKNSPIEFTIEAGRPDTITRNNLWIMHNYGVNRISINPQTFNDSTLEIIGRKHTTRDFIRAYTMAREEGFACINTDIIAGLPGEGAEDMLDAMENLAALKPENITIHTLAIKRASKLNEQRVDAQSFTTSPLGGAKRRNNPETSAIEAQLKIAHEGCTAQGLSPYYLYRQKNMAALFENTGYSLPGYECLYNIGMMSEVQTVLGLGAGAVSKYVESGIHKQDDFPSAHMQGTGEISHTRHLITRTFNPKNPDIYMERRNTQ